MVDLSAAWLKRTGFALLALASALGASIGLAQFGSAAAGPLGDVETLSRSVIERFTVADLSESERQTRRRQLAAFDAIRSNPTALATRPLVGIYEPDGPDFWRRILTAEATLGLPFELIHSFVGWTPRRAGAFPAERLESVWEAGSIGMVTWEPWTEAFEDIVPPASESPLSAVARGRYDEYVDEFARAAASYRRPLFLRFAHEMNDAYRYPWGPQRGNLPAHYRDAFRHVRARFRQQGANNVIWVWAPSVSHPRIEEYYPGADAVDWVATGVLNYGSTMRWSAWWSMQELLAPRYESLARLGHPLMIAEFGTVREGGNAADWYREAGVAMRGPFRALTAAVLFHDANDSTLEHRVVDFTMTPEKLVGAAAREAFQQFRSERSAATPPTSAH